MKIIFRVDAYPEIGLGHFVRSHAIALKLKHKFKIEVIFAGTYSKEIVLQLKKSDVTILQHIKNEKEETFINRILNNAGANLLFIDNLYPYSKDQIFSIKEKTRLILFHNLCEGRFYANAFILPSEHHPEEIINDIRWQQNPVKFYHGFDYIPINEKIQQLKSRHIEIQNSSGISITTGGSDPKGIMLKLLDWINIKEFSDIKFKALPGEAFIKKEELNAMKPHLSDNIQFKAFSYENLLESSLIISTFGVTSYELIYLGIPFISVSHAENNAKGSRILSDKMPIIKDLGHIDHLRPEIFKKSLKESLKDKNLFSSFRQISGKLMDGNGINRIIEIIMDQVLNK